MKYEVVVAGAGPSGSTAAKFLADMGLNVLMVDKSKFPRDKICGGSIPDNVIKDFDYLKNRNDLFECLSSGGYVYSPSLKNVIKLDDSAYSIMVLRDKFDTGLANIAVDAGAEFIDGNGVKDIKVSTNKAEVTLEDGTKVETEIVIGADGVWSTVAKRSGLHQKWAPDEIASCIILETNVGEETIEEFFTEKRFKYTHLKFNGIFGYGWVFPKKEHLNIGIGAIRSKTRPKPNLSVLFRDYIKMLKKDKMIPEDLEIGKCRGWPLPLKLPLKKAYCDRILLCGDAGGFVNPIDGGGIFYGMQTGKIAADVCSWAFKGRGTSEAYLSKYQVECRRTFGNLFKANLRVRNFINMAPEISVKIVGSRVFNRMLAH
ncbi:MAG: NAD(P)/FAD-dependent oxidoreductase [Halobacteriota archaeon]|nr:NAD(P)/FAD-dependent oxidoreductase [Halobacteriota archaeon]